MRKNRLFITVLSITIFLLMNTIGAFAQGSFTDVDDNHWAKDYITKMAEKGIITGYSDATFRPDNDVTKLQSIIMIYRTIKAADKLGDLNTTYLVSKYSQDLISIPTWTDARESVAFALDKGIISKAELNTFITGTTHNSAKRIEVTRFLGKALNLYLKEDINNKFYTFSFKDIEFLSLEDYPYLDLLIKYNIIDSKGDNQGNFNPNKPINRAAAAKMYSIAYDILVDLEVDNEEVEEDIIDEDEDIEIHEAKIDLVDEDLSIIRVIDEDNEKRTFLVNKDVDIIINNMDGDLDDLEVGANVKIYIKNEKLLKIETDDAASFEEGEVYAVIDMNGYHLVTLKNENNKKRTFKLRATAKVEVDGERAKAEDLEKGQIITDIEFDGEYIESIEVEIGERVYEGVLETPFIFGEYPKITIMTYSKQLLELEVDEDAEVEKNNKKRSLGSLTKGDIVTVYTEDNVVVKIVAVSIEEDNEGIIREIVISNQPKITIETDDDELITYDIDLDADIELDDKDVEIYDLRLGYRVELEIESGTVKKIEAEESEITNSITGIITNIYDDNEAIIVKVDKNGSTEKLSVNVEDAKFYDIDGDRIYLRHLDEDYEVLIFGKIDTGIFDYVAERVYIIKKD